MALPSIEELGEASLLVTFGLSISPRLNDAVHALRAALLQTEIPGLSETVAGYASLLVTFDPVRTDVLHLKATISSLLSEARVHRPGASREHVVPVNYGGEDGPDLDEVASLHGLEPDEVIRLHGSRQYRVYFVGFTPGFAYMGSIPPEIATPRLATPRVRTPAGSVGIAGEQTGVYPLSSPGGWRILGRTPLAVWDSNRIEPSLFSPGDRARFVPTDESPVSVARPAPVVTAPRDAAIRVVEAGGLATVQDMGRPGYAHLGLGKGGVFDSPSAIRANVLVGNDPGAALLELSWGGPALEALRPLVIAVGGADFGCTVDSIPVPREMSWFVRPGSTIRFSRTAEPARGGRAYLAVGGGIDVPPVLGSRSTYLPAALGGLGGLPLKPGDLLPAGATGQPAVQLAGRILQGHASGVPNLPAVVTLRFVPFRGHGSITTQALTALSASEWAVSQQSDRMGLRLAHIEGPAMPQASRELASFGVVEGTIQVPPRGNPVILGVDHQTTGGYPVAGVVVQADFPVLAQLLPGQRVRFEQTGAEQARALAAEQQSRLEQSLALLKRDR